MSTRLGTERSRHGIKDHAERLAAEALAAGPRAPLPTCPGWTVADLVEHLGQTLHWVSEVVEDRITDPSRLPTEMAPLTRPADRIGRLCGVMATTPPTSHSKDRPTRCFSSWPAGAISTEPNDDLHVTGDSDLLTHWVEHTAAPSRVKPKSRLTDP